MAALRPSALVLLASTLAAGSACKTKSAEDDAGATSKGEPIAGDSKGPLEPGADTGHPILPGVEVDDPRALALPINQASAPAPIKGKGAKALPSLAKIRHLYALAATAKQPAWGASGTGEAKLSRDDDLDTAWVCKHGQASTCALGFALPESAKVEIVRIYGAAGPRFRDYNGHPRLRKVRIHTDAGYVEATLPEGANHTYVLFDQPITTQTLAVELLDVHKGKTDSEAHFAEVEIYGTEGAPRTPIVLDPAQAWVSWETTAWDDGKSGKNTIRQTFIEFLRGPAAGDPALAPESRRFMRATGVYGKAGDDFLLFERMFGTDCFENEGSYLLFDRRNRMFYPLVDLGGAGAPVYRHREGRGFAAGWIDGERFTVKGIVEDAGELVWKRPPKTPPEDPLALLSEWGFETTPISRGDSLNALPAGCSKPDSAALDRMVRAAKLTLGGELDPAAWMTCSVGTDTLFVSARCDTPAQAYAIGPSDALIGKYVSKRADARGFRLRRTGVGDSMLVELSGEEGSTSVLYWVDAGSFAQLEKAGGLIVRPPGNCPSCLDEWGTLTPAETDESGGDEQLDGFDDGEAEEGGFEDEDDEQDEGDGMEEFEEDEDEGMMEEDEGDDADDGAVVPRPAPPPPAPPPPRAPG